MDPITEITLPNLEELPLRGNDSVTKNDTTVESVTVGTNDEENLILTGDIDFEPRRIKRHTVRENKISSSHQARKETKGPPEGLLFENRNRSFSFLEEESEGKRHLPGEIRIESFAASTETSRLPPLAENFQDGPRKLSSSVGKENLTVASPKDALEELKQQNRQLMEAYVKIKNAHATEKKRFHEILFGIDKALSSLPIRLEKIRVRNQRNLTMINSSRFHSGDGNDNSVDQSTYESLTSEDSGTTTSRDSQSYVSFRMKSLLRKMDQLNDLIHTIQEEESSPIELLVNSELYAISLLKKEIRSTKKQIENSKTDSGTVTSFEETQRDLADDSSSKAKNSFSNELNKASNFKIFENHMMLQEEALNLLTRKIKETEEALLKEIGAKEGLKRENEAMVKEIFRLKSAGEEFKGEKSQKTEKLKPEAEATGTRPYRLIKELKTKLEEKEKSLVAWKSKYTRSEAASSNKAVLLEAEKKKNFELEVSVKNLKTQNKSLTSHVNSLQFLNEQLRDQMEILKKQVEVLANEKIKQELESASKNSKTGTQAQELKQILNTYEEKVQKIREEANAKIQETKMSCEKDLENIRLQLKKQQETNEEFEETFKKLFVIINNAGVEKDIKDIRNPSYNRIREILHISPSDLELLFSAYAKTSADKEVESLCEEFKTILGGEGEKFSENLSTWFFDVLREKLLHWGSGETKTTEPNNKS